MTDLVGKPTAIKVRGTGFYNPAITTAHGSKSLPNGERKNTRYQAMKEAQREQQE